MTIPYDLRIAVVISAVATAFGTPPVAAAPGDPLGPVIPIDSEPGLPSAYYTSMARAANGLTVAAWDADGLKVRVYRPDGTPLGPVRPLPDAGTYPDVAMDDDGDFVVVWASPAARAIRAQGATFSVGLEPYGGPWRTSPAYDADGHFMVGALNGFRLYEGP